MYSNNVNMHLEKQMFLMCKLRNKYQCDAGFLSLNVAWLKNCSEFAKVSQTVSKRLKFMRKVFSTSKTFKVLIVYFCQEVSPQKVELGQTNIYLIKPTNVFFLKRMYYCNCLFFLFKFSIQFVQGFQLHVRRIVFCVRAKMKSDFLSFVYRKSIASSWFILFRNFK